MIETGLESPTTPKQALHDFCKEAVSQPPSVQPSSPPPSTFTSSPHSSAYTSDNRPRAVRSLSTLSRLERRKLSPYAKPDLREDLEMRFTEKLLRSC